MFGDESRPNSTSLRLNILAWKCVNTGVHLYYTYQKELRTRMGSVYPPICKRELFIFHVRILSTASAAFGKYPQRRSTQITSLDILSLLSTVVSPSSHAHAPTCLIRPGSSSSAERANHTWLVRVDHVNVSGRSPSLTVVCRCNSPPPSLTRPRAGSAVTSFTSHV